MPGDSTDRGAGRPRLTRHALLVVLGPALAFTITGVDPLLLTLNLSQVSRGLDVPADKVGFLGGAATLVVAAAVLAVGNLGDAYGLKRLLLLGLGGSVVFETLSALSPNYQFLILVRFGDGLALTSLLGLSLALLTVSVPAELRPTGIGIFMALDAIMYGVMPLVGGWVVETFGWRWLFLIPPPLALLALLLTSRYTTEPPRHQRRRLDVLGVVLFGLALLLIVYGIGALQSGPSSAMAWAPLAVGALALALFLRHELRTPTPALDLRLFTQPAFAVAVGAAVTNNFILGGFGLVLGQLGQYVLALPAQEIGSLYLPGTLLIAAASVLAGPAVAKYTARPILAAGMLIMVVGSVVMATSASPDMALWLLVVATWLTNFGSFVAATPTSDTILAHATPADAGSIAAVQPTFGMTGYALGPTIYLLLLNIFFERAWTADATAAGQSVRQAENEVNAVRSAMATSPGSAHYDPNLILQQTGLALDVDLTNAIRLTMLLAGLLPLAMSVVAYFLMPRRSTTE